MQEVGSASTPVIDPDAGIIVRRQSRASRERLLGCNACTRSIVTDRRRTAGLAGRDRRDRQRHRRWQQRRQAVVQCRDAAEPRWPLARPRHRLHDVRQSLRQRVRTTAGSWLISTRTTRCHRPKPSPSIRTASRAAFGKPASASLRMPTACISPPVTARRIRIPTAPWTYLKSVVHLSLPDLAIKDYWIPKNVRRVERRRLRPSAAARFLLPHDRVMTGSKDGRLYVLDRTNSRNTRADFRDVQACNR